MGRDGERRWVEEKGGGRTEENGIRAVKIGINAVESWRWKCRRLRRFTRLRDMTTREEGGGDVGEMGIESTESI